MKRGKRIVPNFQPNYVKVKHKFECHWEWKDNPDKTYEQDSLEYVIEHFKDKKNLVMLDIGAHIGYWSIQMSPYFSTIHAFECNHDLFPVLTYNILKYKNINLYPYGIDTSTEMVEFTYLTQTADGCIGSYKIPKTEFYNSEEMYKEITVTVSPPKVKGPVDFIKIDVEGAEYNVLKACEKYAKHDPLIHIEIHNDITRKKYEELIKIIHSIDEHNHIARYIK
jgi:FkbM family methyltransferase